MATRRFPVDWPLVIVALLLSIYGIAMVYSAGQTDIHTSVDRLWKSQLVWFCLALVGAYVVSALLGAAARLAHVARLLAERRHARACCCSVGTGAGTAASTKSWLAIGGYRIGQPSELAKITVVLALAKVLAHVQGSAASRCSSCGSRRSSWHCRGC